MSNKQKSDSGPRLFLTGAFMGLADLVPGVSGGTVAFLLGIYDELLYSIKLVTGEVPRLILRGKLKQALQNIPFRFLLPVGLGIVLAIFGLVGVITYLLETQPVLVWSLFFGLVLGSSYVVAKRIADWNLNRYLLLVIGAVLTYLLVGMKGMTASGSGLIFFTTGAIASCAMVLPGISGSLIMVMLGQYKNVIDAVAERAVGSLASFATGAVVGLAIFARLLSWLLRVHHSGTVALLIGVMIGSLRKVWPWKVDPTAEISRNTLPLLNAELIVAAGLMVLGFIIVWKLEKIGATKDHVDIDYKEFRQELKAQHD